MSALSSGPIKIRKIKQVFCQDRIDNIPEYINKSFSNSDLSDRINPGDRIGITVGSRGIANICPIVKQVIVELKKIKAEPFILAAMGSHGGATSPGQKDILASYNVTEKEMGVPILSSMKTVEIGSIDNEIPVYFSKEALQLNGIIALNRVKFHTDFKSNLVESGISKILVVGLGKRDGAESIHSLGVYGLKNIIPKAAELIIEKTPVIQGIGILENGYDQTMDIVFCTPEDILDTDKKLLNKCKQVFPSLPCDKIDVAIVQEMGKNISGTGMDTNIIGRLGINGEEDSAKPDISKLVVLDITDPSHGNALGVGLSDVTTTNLVNKINLRDTYANTITSTFLNRAKIPIYVDTEKEAIEIALKTCWQINQQKLRLLIMKNTLELEYLYVSETIWEEIKNDTNIAAMGNWETLDFDNNGTMLNKI